MVQNIGLDGLEKKYDSLITLSHVMLVREAVHVTRNNLVEVDR